MRRRDPIDPSGELVVRISQPPKSVDRLAPIAGYAMLAFIGYRLFGWQLAVGTVVVGFVLERLGIRLFPRFAVKRSIVRSEPGERPEGASPAPAGRGPEELSSDEDRGRA